jgi:glyoxylase-like metal-dependent hydrolase (beta-lactamase superfamily II)
MTGIDGIRIELEPFKSVRLASNSVRLLAPERMVVVDAGGEPELLRRHLDAIRAAQPDPPLPVCFAQTHAHVDHVAGLTEYGELPAGVAYELAAHERALDVVGRADRAATLADLTGRELTPFRPEGWRIWTVRPAPGGGATEPDLRIPLGNGAFLEAYCTPGHSPDSVTWRVGRVLFAGDLLAATAPLVAGIQGWDRDALLRSLDRLERLMETHDVVQVHVGYG